MGGCVDFGLASEERMSATTVIQSIYFFIVTYNDALDNRHNSRVKQVLTKFLASILYVLSY